MELYQKPVMEIVDLEKVDVLTCSKGCVLKTNVTTVCDHVTHNLCKKDDSCQSKSVP